MARDYDRRFQAKLLRNLASAHIVLRHLFDEFRPASVVDIGCGIGAWLRACQDAGVVEVLGVDGDYVDRAQLLIAPGSFRPCDLARVDRVALDQRYDLAISLEVAEHLPAARAASFVRDLCAAADVVLFSAAIPYQGGRNHVNEQWPSYWIPLFGQQSFRCFDFIRPRIWSDDAVADWYRQNILVFSRVREFPGSRSDPRGYDLVHPAKWMYRAAPWHERTLARWSRSIRKRLPGR